MHLLQKFAFVCLLFTVSLSALNGKDKDVQDSLLFRKYIDEFKTQSDLPLSKLLVNTALFFEGSPYVASTLDSITGNEALVVDFREFDCNTFVETCMSLVLTLKSDNPSFSNYKSILRKIRYRGGNINGYSSRLHYVSDWKYDNEVKNILSDITPTIGGSFSDKAINFMSKHPQLYKNLQNNPVMIQKIQDIENKITDRHDYFMIDKKIINTLDDKILDGDIIAFATSVDGLDYSHIAIAHYSTFGLSFIHASTRTMSVIQEPQSLYSYCMNLKKCRGISVFRLNNLQE